MQTMEYSKLLSSIERTVKQLNNSSNKFILKESISDHSNIQSEIDQLKLQVSEINSKLDMCISKSCMRSELAEYRWIIEIGDITVYSSADFSKFCRWLYSKLFKIKFVKYTKGVNIDE